VTDKQTPVPTLTATIWVGLVEGYDGPRHDLGEAFSACQQYVDRVGLCVTISPTTFVYKHGGEPGVAVGLMNYPRFPTDQATLKAQALELAGILKAKFRQNRVSVVFRDETVMLGDL
jgi:hypothetical protein